VEPKGSTVLAPGTTKITVKVVAEEKETGVLEVSVFVDGKLVASAEEDEHTFEIELTPGTHEIEAHATNYDGISASTPALKIVVPGGEEAKAAGSTGGDTKADTGAAAGTGAGSEGEPTADETKAPQAPVEAKAEEEVKGGPDDKPETKPEAKTDAKQGCFASASPRSLTTSGVALLLAVFAGLMLRRRE
jgi:hypothetical protein